MARRRERLSKAPIVEAIIDVRLAPGPTADPEVFDPARRLLGRDYPNVVPLNALAATFSPEGGELEIRQNRSVVGLLFRSEDNKSVAQFRSNGFTFNRLDPYTDWPTVFTEARRLWAVYSGFLPESRAGRLAVRYINRITMREGESLADYLTAPPTMPSGVPQQVQEYLFRVVVRDADRGVSAVLAQALEPGADRGTAAVLLDIDAFADLQLPLALDNPNVVNIFGTLRDLKNEIFYACITESIAERLE
jgi:uncharacterized protein (TIGR04255 family)